MSAVHRDLRVGELFFSQVEQFRGLRPGADEHAIVAQAPGTVDVMGGIAEDGGSLLLTAAVPFAIRAAIWQTADRFISIHPLTGADGLGKDVRLPLASFADQRASPAELLADCDGAGLQFGRVAALTLRQAVAESLLPPPRTGFAVVLHSDFPPEVDMAQLAAEAVAMLQCLCHFFKLQLDSMAKARVCATAVQAVTGIFNLRAPMTSLCAPGAGGLLQLRFQPQPACTPLGLPPGTAVAIAHTRLDRPTKPERLIQNRVCGEMGLHLIQDLVERNELPGDPAGTRWASFTPVDFVEKIRKVLPTDLPGHIFTSRFGGGLRGINGELKPDLVYKVRSRSEHYIYENQRAYDFATLIHRARRPGCHHELQEAGSKMYCSHWSHSQRCGVGGAEADRVIDAVRRLGVEKGLYGAKVTGAGGGGEIVILMCDDPTAWDVLAEAVRFAEDQIQRPIHIFQGSLPGAAHFNWPALESTAAARVAV